MFALLAQVDLGKQLILNPNKPSIGVGDRYNTVSFFLNLLIPLLFTVSGIILLFLLIGGGFSIIASGGNAKSVEGGKTQVTGAIIGFLVMFAAYWIIQIIQIMTGVSILKSGL